MKLRQLWDWNGSVGRRDYLVWGVLLFALKWNLDRLLFVVGPDGQIIDVVSYFLVTFPPRDWFTTDSLLDSAGPMLLVALPFLWAGLVLTVGRLRSAGLPPWLAVLFVLPVLKWLLMLIALVAPHRSAPEPVPDPNPTATAPAGSPPSNWLGRITPRSRIGSAMAGVLAATAFLLAGVLLGTHALEQYGWGLFLGVPFVAGFVATMIYGAREERGLGESVVVSLLAQVVMAAAILLFAIEGIICVLMAAPLAVALALVGAVLGHAVQPSRCGRHQIRTYWAVVLAMPLMLGAERLSDLPAPLLEVRSSLDIAAPPERVWQHVVAFAELPPPTEWFFRVGVAYPIRAEIDGHGPGAVRHCVFSTGPFVEPIEVWDEPHLLRFGVTTSPPPLEEWTPYRNIHPPHLDGFLASERGQFRLIPLPDGGTRLEGTTWYRHHMWPVVYWQAWSDAIIHRIHLRVLRHIRDRAEEAPSNR